jgi:hypothetical protein
VQSAVARIIREQAYPKLEINSDKTTYATQKYHRSVTGLTLANDGRVTLGRDRKRLIRAQVHRASLGLLSREDLVKLAGMLAFVHAVEPDYLNALVNVYGSQAVNAILKVGSTVR